MNINITDEAVNWFKDEMDLEEGDAIQFYPKYGGDSAFQSGLSIGMAIGSANEPQVTTEKQGISFQIDQKDVWFFNDKDLHVGLKDGEVAYSDEPLN
ncbi:HesB/YadR/YfhF family protein [Alkalibacillus salilacus]|uniref:Uncharacterized protein YneR n=1 Tax=Alkalibacillus salilacus TaxID=284582 RepID=A0ABT9VAW1_9BACI|nr:hypothetical protein [Alkalibacillus salilacus]MDQ0158096.1 uncharacterized protein YneR [Alkalibacillus salilacus]